MTQEQLLNSIAQGTERGVSCIPTSTWNELRRRLERLGRCEAALKRIAIEHTSYDDPAVAPLNSESHSYSIGIVDGHRCAAKIAREALEE